MNDTPQTPCSPSEWRGPVDSKGALLADAVRVIMVLCDHLPDAGQKKAECWDWCWYELNDDAQDAVKNARGEAEAFLSAIVKHEGQA